MKKCLAVFVSFCMAFGLMGCGGGNDTTTAAPATEAAATAAPTTAAEEKTTAAEAATTAAVQSGVAAAILEHAGDAKDLKVALSNSILTNAWRIQMVKIFETYCEQLKEQGVVSEYYATSSGDDAQAQINEIRNLIAEEYDIILVDCASSALQPVLEEAADQGIVVVSFDNIVQTDTTYSIAVDATAFATNQAKWLCEQLGGKGNILLVRGKAGAHDDTVRCAAYEEVLKQYPDIKVVGDGYGEWDFGTTAQLMNDLLAKNEGTQIDGVLQQGMGEAAIVAALEQHGYDPAKVPITGEWTNGYFRVTMEKNLNAFITGVPSYLSAMAMDVALDVVNGKDVERDQLLAPPVIEAKDAEKWYQPSQSDEFMPAYTNEENSWNIQLEDVLE
ncbi:substrate-binding domain-containing protein [Hominifimenecus sp. rT4P-3]|uniref:substrate-binding domain-containing protein n=1 Tax=Hominifimenecus sp. rT4P-3 TaxID=3242979 RepID=UPI003DA3AB4F